MSCCGNMRNNPLGLRTNSKISQLGQNKVGVWRKQKSIPSKCSCSNSCRIFDYFKLGDKGELRLQMELSLLIKWFYN